MYICIRVLRPPGVWGIWGKWLFIFRELGSTGNYFQGFVEQAHSFGDLGSPAKNTNTPHLKGKAFIWFDFFFKICGFWRDVPFENLNVFTFMLTC